MSYACMIFDALLLSECVSRYVALLNDECGWHTRS
ncbi:MAG: hypothetical protein PWR01_512 [Clostridiales bacterium]|nr:hypothetical protein [Clostridiales bacterium]